MQYDFFLFLTFLIGLTTLGGIIRAYRRSRDPFHPWIYLGLMLFVLYCYIPFTLFRSDLQGLQSFLTVEQLEYVQTLNLIGVLGLFIGVLSGDQKVTRADTIKQQWDLQPEVYKRVERAAIFVGIIGVAGYFYGIINVGGIQAAFSRSYGGGSAASGYVRELFLLTLPAILWFMTTHVKRPMSKLDWAWIAFFSLPLLLQGFLGARRGPTAMILVALFVGWHLVRARRPSLPKVIAGSAAIGVLMLFLVTNRGEIYLGSDFEFETRVGESSIAEAFSGNEFIYGAGTILDADIRDKYYWGGRYITVFFIRPIPRQLWPTKYTDAAKWFNTPNLAISNLGTGGEALAYTLGWSGAVGAAPGIIADMWIEFWWFYIVALYAIGWFYGMAWRKVITQGGLWIPIYTLLTALSVYLIVQTLEAMAFRFLFTGAATWLIWRYGKSILPKEASPYLQAREDQG